MATRSQMIANSRNSAPLRILRRTLRVVLLIVATIVVIRAFDTRTLPELAVWHKAALDEEFSAELEDDNFTFENYLEHELAAFDERDAKIASGLGDYPLVSTNRFNRDSVFASANQATDWNRSVELAQASPVGVALLLHGLSDSPYSMRGTAELLHAKGYRVLALRVPGHGTLPSGIMYSSWEDWAAAVRVAARYMTQEIDVGTPFVIVGYSNGGALAIDYALDALEGNGLRAPDKIVLLSPAIGITPFAMFSSWNRALSWLPYFEKFAWQSVLPEYDPYKYNSFPKAAGNESHEITKRVRRRVASSAQAGNLPPILAFAPIVDATVRTEVTVDGLFFQLNRAEDELVLYDVNRFGEMSYFIRADHSSLINRLTSDASTNFAYTIVTNRSAETRHLVARSTRDGSASEHEIAAEWPPRVSSLSHVALPIPPDDPWYGDGRAQATHISLGNLSPLGERNLLSVSPAQILRLRYNPFYDYQSRKILEFLNIAAP